MQSYDRAVLATDDGRIEIEASYLHWKNTFSIDLFGELGSLHVNGLRKWGTSELILRQRVLPSGVPHETREVSVGADLTWQADFEHFEAKVSAGTTSAENDSWISRVVTSAAP
jgi:hypothetical protein